MSILYPLGSVVISISFSFLIGLPLSGLIAAIVSVGDKVRS